MRACSLSNVALLRRPVFRRSFLSVAVNAADQGSHNSPHGLRVIAFAMCSVATVSAAVAVAVAKVSACWLFE